MTVYSEVRAIVSRFSAQTSIAAVEYAAANAPPLQTPTVDPADYAASIWARLNLTPVPRAVAPLAGVGRPGPVGIGPLAPTYREGLITVEHFGPRGSGADGLLGKVDETRAIFHRARFGNVVCRDAEPADIVGSEDEWFQVNAGIFYYVMELFEEGDMADRVVETYAQAAHGRTVGEAVALTGSGIAAAQANASETLAVGVVSRFRTADKIDVAHEGLVTVAAHGYGAVGTRLYLSQVTAGALTTTAPTTGLKQEVARVWDADTLLVRPQVAESLS